MSSIESSFELKLVGRNLLVLFDEPRRVVSSAVLNGGLRLARAILNHQVSKDFDHRNPEGYLRKVVDELGIEDDVVGLMTAADVDKYGMSTQEHGDLSVTAIATAGASNAAACGEPASCGLSNTINIIVLVGARMTDSCMICLLYTSDAADE